MIYLNTRSRKECLIIPCLFKWLFDCTFPKGDIPDDVKPHHGAILRYMDDMLGCMDNKERMYFMRSLTKIITTITHYFRKEKFKTPKCWLITLEIGRALHHAGWIDLLENPEVGAAFNFIDDMFADEGHYHLENIELVHKSAVKHGNKVIAILNSFGLYKN